MTDNEATMCIFRLILTLHGAVSRAAHVSRSALDIPIRARADGCVDATIICYTLKGHNRAEEVCSLAVQPDFQKVEDILIFHRALMYAGFALTF